MLSSQTSLLMSISVNSSSLCPAQWSIAELQLSFKYGKGELRVRSTVTAVLGLYPVMFCTQHGAEHRAHCPCLQGHKIPKDKPSPDLLQTGRPDPEGRCTLSLLFEAYRQEFCSLSKGRFEQWQGRGWRIFRASECRLSDFLLSTCFIPSLIDWALL